jgi:hypothetical protein
MGMNKEISLQQFLFLSKKIRGYNEASDDVTIETHEYDKTRIVGVIFQTPKANINIRFYCNDDRLKITLLVPNIKARMERYVYVTSFPPFRVFNLYYLSWMYLKFRLKRMSNAKRLEKENEKLTEVSRIIDAAFPEEVEKALLGK